MNIYHFINKFAKLYGKSYTRITYTFSHNLIYTKIHFENPKDTQPEIVILKIWLSPIESKINPEPKYEAILWNDAIYTNSYAMPDKSNRNHFYEIMKTISPTPAQHHFQNTHIEFDNKCIVNFFIKNNYRLKELAQFLLEYDITNDLYTIAINELPDVIQIEKWLKYECKRRNLFDKYVLPKYHNKPFFYG